MTDCDRRARGTQERGAQAALERMLRRYGGGGVVCVCVCVRAHMCMCKGVCSRKTLPAVGKVG